MSWRRVAHKRGFVGRLECAAFTRSPRQALAQGRALVGRAFTKKLSERDPGRGTFGLWLGSRFLVGRLRLHDATSAPFGKVPATSLARRAKEPA